MRIISVIFQAEVITVGAGKIYLKSQHLGSQPCRVSPLLGGAGLEFLGRPSMKNLPWKQLIAKVAIVSFALLFAVALIHRTYYHSSKI
jgi:hypothetical protein